MARASKCAIWLFCGPFFRIPPSNLLQLTPILYTINPMPAWGKVQCLKCYQDGEATVMVKPKALYIREGPTGKLKRIGWLLSCGHVKMTAGPPYKPGVKEH